jgi:hypothetical protein
MQVFLFLLLLVTADADGPTPAEGPSWVLGSDSPVADETSDAWLVLPATLGSPAEPVRAEILVPAGLEAWIRHEGETCQAARARRSRVWEGRIISDALVPVCLRASRPQKLRLVARVRLPPGAPPPAVRVVVGNALEVQSRYRSELIIAVASAILGFLASVLLHLLEKRGEARAAERKAEEEIRAAERKAEEEIKSLVGRKLAAEIIDNYHRLRSFLANPSVRPQNLFTTGNDLLLDESRGALAYLREPHQLAFLEKFKRLYALFNSFNQAVNRDEREQAVGLGNQALELLDRSLHEFTGGSPSPGGSP